jgi:putative ABC transport system permease protein
MLKLHFLLAWRNLVKRKVYSTVEVLSLSTGLACLLIVLLYVTHEWSYDQSFSKSENIYRINHVETGGEVYSGMPSALAVHIRQDLPQVTELTRVFFPYRMWSDNTLVQYEDVRFYEQDILDADSTFFKVFDLPFVEGSARTALKKPQSVVLSTRAAKKYFQNESPLGKLITIGGANPLEVTGVVDVPENTHLYFDFLRPTHHNPSQEYIWIHTPAFTYLLVEDASALPLIESQLYDIMMKHSQNQDAAYLKNYHHRLQPLKDVHSTVLSWDIITAIPAKQLYSVLVISLFVLALSVVNFVNLSTARSIERMREVGINKIMGAEKSRLIVQFFTEFALLSTLAAVISIGIVYLTLPLFNQLTSTALTMGMMSVTTVLLFVGVVIGVAILVGLYPSYKLARFQPIEVMTRTHTAGGKKEYLRKTLVVFQFAICIALLSATFIVQKQIDFMRNADLGFEKEHILIMRLREPGQAIFDRLRNSVLTNNSITAVAGSSSIIGGETGSDTYHPDHMPEELPENFSRFIRVDHEFLNLMKIPIKQGRNFEQGNLSDLATGYIVNEAAVKKFSLTDPVGENFRRSVRSPGKIIGVIEDFNFASAGNSIESLVLEFDTVRSYKFMYVKISGNLNEAVAYIENSWTSVIPQYPFEFFFLDQYFDGLYKQEQQIQAMVTIFSGLAIFLAALGLLGLSSFVTLQRTKEIGIRKVVGASITNIIFLLTGNFFKLIAIALAISIPVTYYVLGLWLQNFKNHVTITVWTFLAAGFVTFFVSGSVMAIQSLKAARSNPVKALRQQ